ncbi:MAG: serine/threonine protein kinase, partial [Amphiamblys sp. WSBS2006]
MLLFQEKMNAVVVSLVVLPVFSCWEKCESAAHLGAKKELLGTLRDRKRAGAKYSVCEDKIVLNGIMSLPRYSARSFRVVGKIGEGGNSKVYLAVDRATQKEYIVKHPQKKEHRGYVSEVFIQKWIEHKYVLGVAGFLRHKNKNLPVIEKASKTLKDVSEEAGVLSEAEAKKYVSRIIVAL